MNTISRYEFDQFVQDIRNSDVYDDAHKDKLLQSAYQAWRYDDYYETRREYLDSFKPKLLVSEDTLIELPQEMM